MRLFGFSAALLLLAACETQVWSFDGGAARGRGGDGDGGTSGTICEADVCTCADDELACDNRCIDPTADTLHCGGCNTRCAEGERCAEGRCSCQTGFTRCGGICANLQSDAFHCGVCNQPCTGGTQCRAGTCN